jgi:hypothetical protein
MNTFSRTAAVSLLIIGFSGIQFLAQSTDPLVGTWELNVGKSKFGTGRAPKSETRTYVVAGQDIKATVKSVGSDGKPSSMEFMMSDDGKDRPITGHPDADALSIRRVTASDVEFTLKKAGKVVITGTRTISKDGKMMTITSKGINAAGQPIHDVAVFERR